MSNLTDIIISWLITEPKLRHFRPRLVATCTWIICDCIDHAWADYPTIIIRDNCVDIVSSWDTTHMPAADPDFFSKLHKRLAELCREANGYIN